MSRKYDQQTMQLIAMFEQMTSSKLRDCFAIDDLQVFVVEKGQIGRAVGRSGANVKKLASALKSKIKIIEHSPDIAQFVKNTVHPIKPKRVEFDAENKIALIVPPDLLSRGLLIGRQAIKLRETEKIVQRFFDLTELKVGRPEEGPQTVEEAEAGTTIGDVTGYADVEGVESSAEPNETDEEPKGTAEEPAAVSEDDPATAGDEALSTSEPAEDEALPKDAEVESAAGSDTHPEPEASKAPRKTE